MSKVTLIGAINYFDKAGTPLFENMELPAGLDKDLFIYSCVSQGGEFPLLYGDMDYFKSVIPLWEKKWHRTFTKWKGALDLEYNPIENYDRFEDIKDNTKGNGQNANAEMVSAFNSDAMRDDSQSTGNTSFANEYKHDSHIHGNIGVTTSQQMLESELKIAEWNMYDHMADLFIQEFTVPVYD